MLVLHNYGINDVSKRVNIASKLVNIARVNVVSHNYRVMRPWSHELLTSPPGGAVVQ